MDPCSVERLTPEQLARFRAAWAASYAIDDNRGYSHFAGLHGLPLPTECTHNDTLWLPWHRAYLYFFEMSLQRNPRPCAPPRLSARSSTCASPSARVKSGDLLLQAGLTASRLGRA